MTFLFLGKKQKVKDNLYDKLDCNRWQSFFYTSKAFIPET